MMLVTELAAVPQFTREYSRLDSRSGNGVPSRQLARCLFLVPLSPVAELARIIYRFRGRVPVIPEGGQAT